MHLCLAGLLHFVRNDGILESLRFTLTPPSLRGGEADVAIQDSKPLDCFTLFAMTAMHFLACRIPACWNDGMYVVNDGNLNIVRSMCNGTHAASHVLIAGQKFEWQISGIIEKRESAFGQRI
jgi:hypothetical protein